MNSFGPKLAQVGPSRGGRAPMRAHAVGFAQKALTV
jgi:hypothetical protein